MAENKSNSSDIKRELARLKAVADNDPTNDHLAHSTSFAPHTLSSPSAAPASSNKTVLFIAIGIIAFIIILIVLAAVGIIAVTMLLQNSDSQKEYLFNWEISGFIFDLNNHPMQGVEVYYLGGMKVLSNSSGQYLIKENGGASNVFDQNIILTFKKEGFVPIHKVVSVNGGKYSISAVMFPEQAFMKVDPLMDINANMGGASLSSEANSFIVKGTTNQASTANISLTPFDPTKEASLEAFPGEFSGTRMDGSSTAIETFGFMKVQVKDDGGNALDLASGKTADITLPISPELYDSSPDTIPLWYFDDAKGEWVERGTATKVCENETCIYTGTIDTIASWWNCDQPINTSFVNCDPSKSNKPAAKTFKNLAEETAKKGAKWALEKIIGKVNVVKDVYSAFKLADKIVGDLRGPGDWSTKFESAAKDSLIWAGKKILGKIPGVSDLLSIGSLAADILSGVRDYARDKFNSMFNFACIGTGSNYSGKSSTNFAAVSRNNFSSSQLPPILTPDYSSATNTSMPVKSDSEVNTRFESFDSISETIPIQSESAGQTGDLFDNEFSAITVPIEVNPPEGGGGAPIVVTFTNANGQNTTLQKVLSETNPVSYLTFYVFSGRTGKITVTSAAGNYKKEYSINALSPGEIFEVEEQQIDIPKIDFGGNESDVNFSCPAHYAYVKEIKVSEDTGFTTNDTYQILYYDGVEYDRASSINLVRLYGDNIAYEKSLYYTSIGYNKKGDYCGDFYYYNSENKTSCTDKETHIIYNKKDLGKGQYPELWANHIAFEKIYPDKGFVYDGVLYGAECKYVNYELWGDNFAYECTPSTTPSNVSYAQNIYWNGNLVSKGNLQGIHKNFMIIDNRYDLNNFDNYCYSLYDNGKRVLGFDKAESSGFCPQVWYDQDKIGVFGDHYWWMNLTGYDSEEWTEKYDIYYDGNFVYSTTYPQAVVFGRNFVYGNYDELFFNGNKITDANMGLVEPYLFGNNVAIISGRDLYYNGIKSNVGFNFDGSELKLFGNNYGVFNASTSYAISNSYYNGVNIGEIEYGSGALLENKYAVIQKTQGDYGKLIYGGKVFDENLYYISNYAIFGDNIYHEKSIYEGGSYKNQEFFINGESIGLRFYKDNNEILEGVVVWPKMTPEVQLGTENSNYYSIWEDYGEERSSYGAEYDGLMKEYSFQDTYLYCTNQWK